MKYFFYQYQLPIICGGLGLILAILFVSIGFFKTLLIIILTALGIAVGFYLKQSKLLDHYFKL
ncbi:MULTISPECIES: DUF2273 domain-containing protein [Enterococcus]|uniref:DUF2273 domain-containing protein n=1 Tax=Enterococcus diestrammenae TaxID=1155073 RepID=A0ABV0EZW3_9ENTE|nr:DUF2273 domain-containing protein [Enterococcus diestrammenae]KAF1298504.1 DUF2273 domain-containing protein [Enterococcus diestrammenae]